MPGVPSAPLGGAVRLSPTLAGGLWVVATMFCFTLLGAIAKLLGDAVRLEHIVFFRCLFGAAALLPLLWRMGFGVLRPRRPWLNWARAGLGAAAMSCGLYAVRHMPVADAVAIAFTAPFFTLIFSRVFLGEKLTWRSMFAVALGFGGMLLVARPSGEGYGLAALVALGGALFNGTVMTMMRPLVQAERPATLLLHFNLVMTVLVAPPALLAPWPELSVGVVGGVVAIGALALVGQNVSIQAYRASTPAALAPFSNVQLLFAALFGYLFFGEIPDAAALAGMAVIVAAILLAASARPVPAGHVAETVAAGK